MERAIGERLAVGRVAAALLTVIAALVVGGLTIKAPSLAVLAGLGAVFAAAAVVAAGPLVLLIFPAVFVARRVGPGTLNMSGADVILVVSALVALPLVEWHNAHVRRVAGVMAMYLAVLLVTVVASPGLRAVLELAHRASFLLGGLTVGAAVGRLGRARDALRLLVLGAIAVSLAAVVQSVGSGLAPAFPLGLQKNYAGALLAMTLIVLFVVPEVLGFNRTTTLVLRGVLFGGIVATQSRGALAGLLVALALWSVVSEGRAVRAVVLVPAVGLVVLAIFLSVQADTDRGRNSDFTPVNARRISYEAALKEWRRDPLLGVGLRYYKAPGYRFDVPSYRDTYIEPHSLWYSTLAESGIVGLIALAGLVGFSLRALRQAGGPLAFAAGLVVIAKLTHGMVDIYWVAGTQTLPWLLVGLAVGRAGTQLVPPGSAVDRSVVARDGVAAGRP